MALPIERDIGSIVLLGQMNPAIFQPEWFVRHGLLRSFGDGDDKLEIVSPAVTAFSTETFRLLVESARFNINCNGPDGLEVIRDLVLGAFSRLEHTPITTLGINRELHFRAPSIESWHDYGHRLAPKEPWNGAVKQPGMMTVQMSCKRLDETGGNVSVTVQPSRVIPKPGICVHVNDQYDRGSTSTTETMSLLATEFSRSVDSALEIGKRLTESVS